MPDDVYKLERHEIGAAIVFRVFDLDVTETIRAGQSAQQVREDLSDLSLRKIHAFPDRLRRRVRPR